MSAAKQLRVGFPFDPASSPGFTTFTLDASTDAMEFIFQAPESIVITKLGFRYGARTGTPPTFKISLQGVDGSGNPDGTIKGGGSPASATFTPPASTAWDGTWQWVTLANSYTCARGELLALVIKFDSGTIDGSNNSSFTELVNAGSEAQGFPYAIQNNAGARTKRPLLPVYGYASSTTAYGNPCETAIAKAVFGSTDNPDEVGMTFNLPAGWGDTYKVVGVRFLISPNAGSTLDVTIYDTDGSTVLQRVAYDTDHGTTSTAQYEILFDEATLSTLNFGSTYRVSVAPAGTITLYGLQVDAAADWDAWPGGQDFAYSTRVDAGAWTQDATKRLLLELILADVTEPAGGGGGSTRLVNGGLVAA
jgi:hypothetical protein